MELERFGRMSAKRGRYEMITLRITTHEYNALVTQAKALSLSLNEYCRQKLLLGQPTAGLNKKRGREAVARMIKDDNQN